MAHNFVKACAILAAACSSALGGPVVWALSEKAQRACSHLRQPETGQPGKDVVWMPTTDALTTKMLELAKTTQADRVFDLGAGDGRIPIAAAKDFGASAVGVEYEADLVKLAQCLVTAEGVSDKVKIERADVFEFDFSSASVVTLYLLPEINLRLRPRLLAMAPGTRVVSHSWLMDEWEPDDQVSADGAYAYLWIVPANVAGTWTFVRSDGGERFTVQLEQSFQNITGRIASGDASRPLWRSRVRGAQIEFAYAAESSITTVVGTVSQDRIQAQVTRNGSVSTYQARRL
jgi:SAM-dependent methyltransferase